jgi:hypothetical protein
LFIFSASSPLNFPHSFLLLYLLVSVPPTRFRLFFCEKLSRGTPEATLAAEKKKDKKFKIFYLIKFLAKL